MSEQHPANYQEVAMSMMDLRHVHWNADQAPCVNIVESPAPKDLLAECQEGVALHAALRQARIPSRYYLAINKEMLKQALEFIAMQRHFAPRGIALHISCHGGNDGIQLTSGEVISWEELREILIEFGVNGCSYVGDENTKISTLILCMSTCYGLAAHHMSENGERPFMALIGPSVKVNWSDSLASFLAIYNLFMLKGKPLGEAVRVMNAVAGVDELFHVADFSNEVKAWADSQSTQS